MVDLNTLTFLAFISYLAALLAILLMLSRRSPSTIILSPQTQPEAKPPEKPPKPKVYLHTITATPNNVKLLGFLKQLEEQGISYTMTKHEKTNTIQFKTDRILQNIDELKRKGVILDAKIEEVEEDV